MRGSEFVTTRCVGEDGLFGLLVGVRDVTLVDLTELPCVLLDSSFSGSLLLSRRARPDRQGEPSGIEG